MSNKIPASKAKSPLRIFWTLNRRGGGNKTTLACAKLDAHLDADIPVSLAEIEQEARITPHYEGLINCRFFPFNGEEAEAVLANGGVLMDCWDEVFAFLEQEVKKEHSVVVDMGANADIRFAQWLENGGADVLMQLQAEIVFVVPISTDRQTYDCAMASLDLVLPLLPKAKILFALSASTSNLMISCETPALGKLLEKHKNRGAVAVRFPVCVSGLMRSRKAQERRPMDVALLSTEEFLQEMGYENTLKNQLKIGRDLSFFKKWWYEEVDAAGIYLGTKPSIQVGSALTPVPRQNGAASGSRPVDEDGSSPAARGGAA